VVDQAQQVVGVEVVEARGCFLAAVAVSRDASRDKATPLVPAQELAQEPFQERLQESLEQDPELEQEQVTVFQFSAHWQTQCSPPCHLC